ncbi:MAG: MSCRAMM family protein [Actinomycetota bacterium]
MNSKKQGIPGRRFIQALAVATAVFGFIIPAAASHPEVSLAGSNFEIDTDANLKRDDASPSIDWASVTEARKADLPSGTGDNAFGQGSKEDTAVPTVVSGSIPPNKSDLKFFGAYQEQNGANKFLHLYWSRVQDPSGSTNMDFEFNQKLCNGTVNTGCSSNGVTPIRTAGDLLVIYDLTQGGTTPVLSLRTWNGSAWGSGVNLTSAGKATGSINNSPISSADADGLGAHSARTFGEASINLNAIFDPTKCQSFGSAYLKSRSSPAFTAELKDFIAPQPVNLTNCGRVVVKKVDQAGAPLPGAAFTINPANAKGATNLTQITPSLFCIDNLLFGTTYTVHESVVPTGHRGAPDQTFVPSVGGDCSNVTGTTPPDRTFVNVKIVGAIKVVKRAKHAAATGGSKPHANVTFTIKQGSTTVGTVTTNSSGEACLAGLSLGQYTITETVPTGYRGEAPKTVNVTEGTCTSAPVVVNFTNTPLSNITVSAQSQVPGGTASKIQCTGLTATPADSTPGSFDDTSETFKDLMPGTYTCTVEIDP